MSRAIIFGALPRRMRARRNHSGRSSTSSELSSTYTSDFESELRSFLYQASSISNFTHTESNAARLANRTKTEESSRPASIDFLNSSPVEKACSSKMQNCRPNSLATARTNSLSRDECERNAFIFSSLLHNWQSCEQRLGG